MSELFSDIKLGPRVAMKNRLAVAPMTTGQSEVDGSVSDAEAAWLERLASDGYGMIITCAAAISRKSIAFRRQMSLGEDRFLPGLSVLARRMNQYPTLKVVQLCHGGSRAIPELTGVPAHSASAYELAGVPGFVKPKAFSVDQIHQIIDDHARASERAAKAGFDGVEFHGANGYLFTQFISQMTNQRKDHYGGNLENRARFAREVVQACRERVPANFILGFRMSFEGFGLETGLDLDENIQIMNWLAEDGIDYGHLSSMDLTAKSVKYPEKVTLERVRSGVNGSLPIIVAGGVFCRADAQRALDLGADIVAVGRAAIGNSNIPYCFQQNEVLTPTPFSAGTLGALGVSQEFLDFIAGSPLAAMGLIK